MPWFNPPLTKPGIRKCPRCGERTWPWRWGFWVGWAFTWRCARCQALLKWDTRRGILGFLFYFPVYCAALAANMYLPYRPWRLSLVLGAAIIVMLLIYWWMATINLVEEEKPAGSLLAPGKSAGPK